MKTITVSAKLADILRERIDTSTNFKRNAEIDKQVLADYKAGKPLSDEKQEMVANYVWSPSPYVSGCKGKLDDP